MTIALLVLLALTLGALEAALAVLGRERLRRGQDERVQRLTALLARREELHLSLRAVELLGLALAAALAGVWWAPLALAGGDLLARSLGVLWPRTTTRTLWWLGDWIWRLTRPVTRWIEVDAEPNDLDDEPDEAVLEVAEVATLPPSRRQRIADILDFGEQTVDDVMTARTDIVSVAGAATVAEASAAVLASGRSRLLVVGDSADEVLGVVHARDLLRAEDRGQPVVELAREPLFLADAASLELALREMRVAHSSLAVVVDEYGGTAGLVTIEDLVEEIVGEIHDESDPHEPPPLVPRTAGGWLGTGRAELDTVWSTLDIDPPDVGECQTLGGLVFSLSGDLPVEGEVVFLPLERQRLWFLVTGVGGRRVTEAALVLRPGLLAGPAEEYEIEPPPQPWPGDLALSTVEDWLGYDDDLGGQVPSGELFALWPAAERVGRSVIWRRHRVSAGAAREGVLDLLWSPLDDEMGG